MRCTALQSLDGCLDGVTDVLRDVPDAASELEILKAVAPDAGLPSESVRTSAPKRDSAERFVRGAGASVPTYLTVYNTM